MTRKRKPAALLQAAEGHQQLLERVAAEYGVEPDSDKADHIATLIVLRKAIRDRAWRGDPIRTDPDDMAKIDALLKQYLSRDEGVKIEVHFVEGAVGIGFATCPECGHRAQHRFEAGALEPLPPKPPIEKPEPVAVAAPPPAKDNVVELGSRLHCGSEGGGNMGAVYVPAANNTAADLWRNDLNPTRSY
jgi:hypothetical protein